MVVNVNKTLVFSVIIALAIGAFGEYGYQSYRDHQLAASATPAAALQDTATVNGTSEDVKMPHFTVSGLNFVNGQLKGFVTNTSDKTLNVSMITVDYLDSSGHELGKQVAMYLSPLAPGQQESFSAGWVVRQELSDNMKITVQYY